MEPNRVGRILGIGARVAAKTLQERTAQATSPAPRQQPSQPKGATAPAPNPTGASPKANAAPLPKAPTAAAFAEGSRRMARGAGRFSAALLRPFAHATGILTLQITGVFFALFTFVFGFHSWQLYKAAGWRDHHLPMYVAFAVLFAWFALSSFWRANRKHRQ